MSKIKYVLVSIILCWLMLGIGSILYYGFKFVGFREINALGAAFLTFVGIVMGLTIESMESTDETL